MFSTPGGHYSQHHYQCLGGDAVSFFFVLSGFILAYTYHRRQYSLKSFYIARLARIFPAAILSIAIYVFLLNPYASSQGPASFVTVSNLLLLQSIIPIPAYYFALNAVLWSVSVEVFFYLLFPVLDRGLKSFSGRILLAVVSLASGILLVIFASSNHYPEFSASSFHQITWHGLVYINPFSRLKEFVIGMLAGRILLQWYRRSSPLPRRTAFFTLLEMAGIAALFWCLPFVSNKGIQMVAKISTTPQILGLYVSQVLTALFFAVTIFVFAIQGGLISRILRNKMFVIGGEISFSVYLFHQIFIVWQSSNAWLLSWCAVHYRFSLLLLWVLFISYVIWRWFECPMRTFIRQALDRS